MRKALFALAVASSLAAPFSLLGSLQTLLDSVWNTAPIAKAGCGMDPNGRCVPAPAPQTQLDAGCGADPDGRCKAGS
jgi:hypothetical protein